MYGLFSAVSLQKSVRDRMKEVPVMGIYFALCWVSLGLAVLLLFIGLYNINMTDSEKGFCARSFLLSLVAAVTAQKNARDIALASRDDPATETPTGA